MSESNNEATKRAADLHHAYQYGVNAAEGDVTAEPAFNRKFAGHTEAEGEFQRGLAEQQARKTQMWTVLAGPSTVFTERESACRDVFESYKEWRFHRTEAAARSPMVATGLHPQTWDLPVELVDPTGSVQAFIGDDLA